MKAIVYTRYGPPEVLTVQEVTKPAPKDNEVLIRVHAAVVTTTDCMMRGGKPFIVRVGTGITRPTRGTLGVEFAGEIETVGKSVTRFHAGDQVFGAAGSNLGAHAEYICLPEDGSLAPKPTTMTFAEAAATVEGGLTALPFLRDKGRLRKGKAVLINGASGSVGTAAVQLAHAFGADVTGVCSTKNLELVRSLGADQVIDYTKEDFTQSGRTYDIIFDTVAKSSFRRCRGALTPRGVYLSTVPTPGALLQILWSRAIGGKRAVFTATGLRPPEDKARDLKLLSQLIEAGKYRAIIDQCYSIGQVVEAHRYVDAGHKRGNVVIMLAPNDEPNRDAAPDREPVALQVPAGTAR